MQYPPSVEDRAKIIAGQNGKCLLCGKGKKLVIDHDHRTGEIRGALCSSCNTGLGQFYDSTPLLYAAITYLNGYTGIAEHEQLDPELPCAGSWRKPFHESPHTYRCAVCDQPSGARKKVKMELVRRGEYMVREHFRRGGRGKSKRVMSAVEAIH